MKLSKIDSVVVFIMLYTRHFIESVTQNTYYYMAKTKYLIQIVPQLYMNYGLGKFEGQRYPSRHRTLIQHNLLGDFMSFGCLLKSNI